MKNFVANGESIQLTAGVGGIVGGALVKKNGLIGVVVASAIEGDQYTLRLKGAYEAVPKTVGEAWSTGELVYFIHATGSLSKVPGAAGTSTYAGVAFADALAADVVGSVLLAY